MAVHKPLILTDAGLKLGDGTTPTEVFTELACDIQHLEISPDTAVTTVDTMCGSTDYPGLTKWSLVMTLVQTYDVGGVDEALTKALTAAAAGKAVGFKYIPYKSQPISATNPVYTGTVVPEPFSPVNGDAGDVSTIDVEWAIVGQPVKSILATPPYSAETAAMEAPVEEPVV